MNKVQARIEELKKLISADFLNKFSYKDRVAIITDLDRLFGRLKKGRPKQADLIRLTVSETAWAILKRLKPLA